MVSQRSPTFGPTDALTPIERSGISLLRTWQRGAVRFRWTSDGIITAGFLDEQDMPRSRPLARKKGPTPTLRDASMNRTHEFVRLVTQTKSIDLGSLARLLGPRHTPTSVVIE